MTSTTGRPRIHVVTGDIAGIEADAIVNAANASLLGGGGVDGAIHQAAGPMLLDECRTLGGCPIGEARLTQGYNLPARFVIHTVGPVWQGGEHDEDALLAACYRNSLALAATEGLKTVAIPAISTGAYRFPLHRATAIAVHQTQAFLEEHPDMEVTFVCFGEDAREAYLAALREG